MVKVVRFHEFGGPEVFRIDDLDVGEPGPGEVRIRVGAIGLNRVEVQFRQGQYLPPQLPSTIGFDAAGCIEAVGPNVTQWAPGDRVATLTGVPMDRYGTYAEAILFPANMLARVQPQQTLREAAACWMQYFTAYAIVEPGLVSEGDHVVITAASSSVALAAIQIARAQGAVPIAVTRGSDKVGALVRAGASHVIVSSEEDIATRVRELTQGRGARLVFDPVGGRTFSALAGCTAPGGTLIYYGVLDGVPVDFPWMALLGLNLTVRGFAATSLSLDPAAQARVIAYVQERLEAKDFQPIIDSEFALDDVVRAHQRLESNAQFGKIIMTTDTVDE